MHCMHCGKKLPLLRKFQGGEFCSEQHRAAYSREADRLALRRLIETPTAQSRPAKGEPEPRTSQNTARERSQDPPVQRRLFSIALGTIQTGDQLLASRASDLIPMGRNLALGYFRGAKPRARLWLPVSSQTSVQDPVVQTVEAVRADVAMPLPVFRFVLCRPASPLAIDPVDWQQLQEELDEAKRRTEAGPPSAGLVELANAVAESGVPAPAPALAHEPVEESITPEELMPAAALPRLRLQTSNSAEADPAVPVHLSRQLRVRPASSRAGEPPLARPAGSLPLEPREGSRAGKLDMVELPTVLARRPEWPREGWVIRHRGIPVAGEVSLGTMWRTPGLFESHNAVSGEPLIAPDLMYPTLTRGLISLPMGGGVDLPLPASRGIQAWVNVGAPTPQQTQPFLEPPNSVPLSRPVLDPPLSSLRALAVMARNPVASRRPATLPDNQAAGYDPKITSLPAVTRLGADSGLVAARLLQTGGQPAGAVATPIVREEGWPAPLPGEVVKPIILAGSGYSLRGATETTRIASGVPSGVSFRLFPLPHDRFLPRDCSRRPSSELAPLAGKGFIILSSSRMKLRTEESSLRKRLRLPVLSLPKLGSLPKWTAGVMMMVLAFGAFFFTVAPRASGNITPEQPSAWSTFQHQILQRAAVALTDDFRSGLADWTGKEGWGSSWSFDNTGFVRTGALALYSPSLGLNDYRFEFLGQIEKKALSWVVRAADLQNYQVVRLELAGAGPQPRAFVVRYPVLGGKKGRETRTELPMQVALDTVYRVAMEVQGADHVLMVQGQVVDSWTEANLGHGGIGFFSGAGERARLRWVGVWHHYDALGRLCAYLAPRQPGTLQ